MSATVSLLGVYLKRGERSADDFYYYTTDRIGYFMMVPHANVLRPSLVHRPLEDREDWVAVGGYGDDDYDAWITTETLAAHRQRITNALLVKVDRMKREKDWFADELRQVTKERNILAAEGEVRVNGYTDLADKLNRIYDIVRPHDCTC